GTSRRPYLKIALPAPPPAVLAPLADPPGQTFWHRSSRSRSCVLCRRDPRSESPVTLSKQNHDMKAIADQTRVAQLSPLFCGLLLVGSNVNSASNYCGCDGLDPGAAPCAVAANSRQVSKRATRSALCSFHQASSNLRAFLKFSGAGGRNRIISTPISGCLPTSGIADFRIGP